VSRTIGSLFSGIGGLELGLEMCGLGPVIWQCDSDPYARAVLEAHWPGVKRYDDVRSIDAKTERPTIICGGFPCQPVSTAGSRKAQKDPRWLWPFFAGVIARLRPLVVFIENVPGLRTAGLRDVLADLASLGFDAEWGLFSAAEVGAPHHRQRLFVLAHDNQEHGPARLGSADEHHREGPLQRGDDPTVPGVWVVPSPEACSGDDGIPGRLDIGALGNACVPAQAALAWRTLTARLQPPTLPE
jgi:DNA (cytosine-5)-methyltransferase 1